MAAQTTQTIFGVDIVKGSSRSREAPRYAVAVLNGSVEKYSSVSRFKLLRLIRQYCPAILAVDSITELAENRKELVRFLKRLPPDVKLVQVTGNEHQEPLTKLGRDNGISFNPIMPDEEAFAAACLASMGVGYIVSAFEDKTVIKVSRGRSLGRGGWSQNRYRRKVQGKVREKVRDIEAKLKDRVYDMTITEGFGGYVNGTFIVNARRSELGIHSSREEDVQVTVTSVEKEAIEFIPLERRKRDYIIVGVDPGTTTAVAVLDLNGRLVEVTSSRVSSIPEIIEHISEKGRPVLIATDVVPPPSAVEKIKRAFKAVLFTPNERIPVEEKVRLARPLGYSNDHERDALAAAVKAFNTYKNKFAQIDKKTPSHLDSNDVKALAIEGKPIDVALDMLTVPPARQRPKEAITPEAEPNAKLEELRAQLKRKDEQVENLRAYMSDLRHDLKHLELRVSSQDRVIRNLKSKGIDDVRRTKEVTIRDGEIARLRKDVADLKRRNAELQSNMDRLKHIRAMEFRGDKAPVKVVESLSKEAVLNCDRKFGIKPGDVIFVREAGGGVEAAAILAERGVKAVIKGTPMSHLAEERLFSAKVPVLSRDDVPLKFVNGYAVLDPGRLEAAIEKWKGYAADVEKRGREEKLLGIIDEYRAKRAREYRNDSKAPD
jgi:predicted RNase H-like nuclease (RuvC/YqgF family)